MEPLLAEPKPVDPRAAAGGLTVRAFEPDDAGLLSAQLNMADATHVMPDSVEKLLERTRFIAEMGPSASIYWGDHLIACGGLAETLCGVAEAWAIVGADVTRLALQRSFARLAKRLLADWVFQNDYHRIYCCVPATSPKFYKWALFLGFQYEATLQWAAGRNVDMWIFAKLIQKEIQEEIPWAWKH